MRDKFFALLGIESGEKSMVSMLLTQSIFLGIFFGSFDVTAHSLLLSVFDEKMLARGYVFSGIAGIILIYLYSWLQTKMQFRNFSIINLSVVTTLTFFLWLALIMFPAKWMIFILFIMLGPLNFLAILGFLGTADRLFPNNQGKRISRFIDAGIIIGIIIISYSIPVLLSLKFQLNNILLVSASSVFVATIIQMRIGMRFKLAESDHERYPEKNEENKYLFSVIRQDPYIRVISLFAALSVLAAFFVQYLFMAVTREQYPAAEDMARFLGFFAGSTMIFILSFRLVVFEYILHNYGLRTCLIFSPILVAVFTAISIAIGLSIGYTPESTSGFLIYFILIAFCKLFSKSLKISPESSLFKVIYLTIDRRVKHKLQSGIFGTVNGIATFSSGLILTFIGVFSFIRLIHFSLVLFILTIILVFIAFRLYIEYRNTIIKETEKRSQSGSENNILTESEILKNRFSGYIHFRTDYFNLISGDYQNLENIRNKWYFEKIINQAHSEKDINLLPVLKKTAFNSGLDETVRQHSLEAVEILEKYSTTIKSEEEKISEAKKILAGTRRPQTTLILRLLRDNSIESKRLAIYMIGKFRLSDLLPEVCTCLSIPGLEIDASAVLHTFGKDAEDDLFRVYLITSGNVSTSKAILRLLGKTGTKESIAFLFSRLGSNSRQMKEVALKCLIDCGFKPTEEDKVYLHQLTSEVIGLITWTLSIKICLKRSNDNFLLEEVNKEITRWKMFLFNVLSITYNSATIAKIRESLGSETLESVSYAHEMISIVINDTIKPKLISLLDAVPDEDKLKNLFRFFPGEIPGYKKLSEDIINCDYNFISLWTKACTLRNISVIESDEMAESVIALLFNPEEIIHEESANLIARSSHELYRSASARIPDSTKKRIDRIINGPVEKNELLFEKVQFLSKYFVGIPEDELLPLAGAMKYIKNFDAESQMLKEGCIIWSLSGDKIANEVHILYYGEKDRLTTAYQSRDNLTNYFIPLIAIEEYLFQFPDNSNEILKYIDKNEE